MIYIVILISFQTISSINNYGGSSCIVRTLDFDFQNRSNIFLTLDVHCIFYSSPYFNQLNFRCKNVSVLQIKMISKTELPKCNKELKITAIPERDLICLRYTKKRNDSSSRCTRHVLP